VLTAMADDQDRVVLGGTVSSPEFRDRGWDTLESAPAPRDSVTTMLCMWGWETPCGPQWCSNEAATERWV
jgi:hypothetical protein